MANYLDKQGLSRYNSGLVQKLKGIFALHGETATDAQVATAVTSWLNTNVDPVGSAVVVDNTLLIEGAAADAKKTGKEVTDLKTALLFSTSQKISVEQGFWGVEDGAPTNDNAWCRTENYVDKDAVFKTSTMIMCLLAYDVINGTYIGTWNGTAFSTSYATSMHVKEIAFKEWAYSYPNYRFKVDFYNAGTVITPADVLSDLAVTDYSYNQIDNVKNSITGIEDEIYNGSVMTAAATASGWRLNESDGLCSQNDNYQMVKYAVNAGDIVRVISDDRFQFQTVASVPASGTNNRVGSTYGVGTFTLEVPNTATYLIVSTPISNSAAACYSETSKIGIMGRVSFDVASSSDHSSSADKIDITIPSGKKVYIGVSVDDANTSSLFMLYAYKQDATSHNIANWYPQKAGNKLFEIELDYDAVSIGIFFRNGIASTVHVEAFASENLEISMLESAQAEASGLVKNVGSIYRESFSVNAGSTHSSALDKIQVDIPANTPFVYGIDASVVDATSVAMIYAIKSSDSSYVNFRNVYPAQTANLIFTETLDYDVKEIGVFYYNTTSSATTVKVIVAVGQLEIDALYRAANDGLFVVECNSSATREIYERFAITDDAETFVFYSDPHYLGNNGGVTESTIQMLENEWLRQVKVKADAINAQAVICGGDMINTETTDAELCYKLGMHNAIARKLFGNKYHLALGNHDTRFDATAQSVFDNMLFVNENTQKAYYSIKTPKTKFYVLNTGTDQDSSMNSYRWDQISWLADKLIADTDLNRILVMHIFSNSASSDPANFGNGITPMATNVISLINAYNSKSTVTLNGSTYNFANAIGKVRCILTGHMHYDTVYTATGGIPVVCIDDSTAIGTSIKIIIDSCFVDYDNGKLYAYRDGATTREVTLA